MVRWVLIGTVLISAVLASGFVGVRAVRSMVTEPAITHRLATEAAGTGWRITHVDAYSDTYHRYIVKNSDGARRDVNVTREPGGEWQAKLTPTF